MSDEREKSAAEIRDSLMKLQKFFNDMDIIEGRSIIDDAMKQLTDAVEKEIGNREGKV